MLTFSRIDENFTVYRGKKIVIFGAGNSGIAVYNYLKNICEEIVCFCDNDVKKQGAELFGRKIISIEDLKKIYNKEILIQIASIYESEIEKQLLDSGYNNYVTFGDYWLRKFGISVYYMYNSELGKSMFEFLAKEHLLNKRKLLFDYIYNVNNFNKNQYCFHCMPMKTGDSTLSVTTSKYTEYFYNLCHTLDFFDQIKDKIDQSKTIKFVTATRDVIAQNISCFFQESNGYWVIKEFWKDGGDVQFLFDLWLKKFLGNDLNVFSDITSDDILNKKMYGDYVKKDLKITYVIQCFFQEQYERYLRINLFEYPFDKEKGYSIVKVGNIEIFIYQLEKLNDIAPYLGEFMGLDEFELENANEASKKWYSRLYKRALKELKISREYFDACYNSEVMRHFYSDKDIEKFKNRWKNNIFD